MMFSFPKEANYKLGQKLKTANLKLQLSSRLVLMICRVLTRFFSRVNNQQPICYLFKLNRDAALRKEIASCALARKGDRKLFLVISGHQHKF